MGLRDYAMILLIATYGLRVSEVAAMTLDDIRWRQGCLRIHQRKISSPLELPLTNEVSTALVKHLKRTPPPAPYRRIFLRMRAPIGVLKRTVIRGVFSRLVRKSDLSIGINTAAHLERSLKPVQTFLEYADWWEKNIQPTHQPSSGNSSHYILKKHLRPRFGDMPLDSITQESVQEWIADLQREGELKPRSIKNVWKVLRLILGKKRVKDWTIRLPKNPKKEQRWFTVQEMDRIIDAAWGQYKFIFQLARATGMRSGELFGLRVEDLDLESAIVHIRRSTWGHLEVTPKTDPVTETWT
jgi:integrase